MGQSWSQCLNYTIPIIHYLSAASLIQTLSPKSIFLFSVISQAVVKQHRHIATHETIYSTSQISCLTFVWSWQTVEKVVFFFKSPFCNVKPLQLGRFHVAFACSPLFLCVLQALWFPRFHGTKPCTLGC